MTEVKDTSTLEKIHIVAKREFLDKGFQQASLRNIVKTAGVTTGAFYGYYKSKEELFDALVGEKAEHVLKLFDTTLEYFNKLSGEEQTNKMTDISSDAMLQMLDYIFLLTNFFHPTYCEMGIWKTFCKGHCCPKLARIAGTSAE